MSGNQPGQHFAAELAGAGSNNSPTVILAYYKMNWGSVFFSPHLLARRAEGKKEKERKREYPTRHP
jgi:hypothetical protein